MVTILNININTAELISQFEGDRNALRDHLSKSVQALAASTHAHIMDEASKKLHSRYRAFAEAMKDSFQQINDTTWAVTIPQEAMWIEDGQTPWDMTEMVNTSPKARIAKDGSKYLIIPFNHSKGPTYQTQSARSITDLLKRELKAKKVPYQKIEKGADGRPKTGLLHSLDLGGPKKSHWTSPALDGVRVYQKVVGQQAGQAKVQRSIMTFRIMSSKHSGEKWAHPGLQPMNFIDSAYEWAMKQWHEEIMPEILTKFGIR